MRLVKSVWFFYIKNLKVVFNWCLSSFNSSSLVSPVSSLIALMCLLDENPRL